VLAETGSQGQLPFTGTDLIVFTAVGLVLIGAGVAMRRASRRSS
jgi:LPXTG-motif cell wall-anchored protein